MPQDANLIQNQLRDMPTETVAKSASLPNGIMMHWFEVGTGPVVVLLHGFPDLPITFRHQIAAFSNDYKVILPHLRGYGPTTSPIKTAEYQLHLLVEDVSLLARSQDWERFHLVGHDWGGTIAWQMAMTKPEQVKTVTVLNSCPPRLLFHRFFRSRQFARSWYMVLFQLPGLAERLFRARGSQGLRKLLDAAVVTHGVFDDRTVELLYQSITSPGFGGLKYYRAAGRRRLPQLEAVDCPAQLLWGAQDPALGIHLASPDAYRNWASSFQVHHIDNAGHWVHLEAHDTVNTRLKCFWEAHDGR